MRTRRLVHVSRSPTACASNLTEKLGVKFWREDHDTPNLPPAYGIGGLDHRRQVGAALRQVRHLGDPADGTGARMVTSGEGRKQQIVFRYRSLDPEQKAIPIDKPLLLAANDDRTEANGFYRVSCERHDGVHARKDRHDRQVVRAGDQGQERRSRWCSRCSRFDEFPDLWVSDTTFRDMKKVSSANPQQSEYVWGKSELMLYTNADGKTLRAIITKPERLRSVQEVSADGLHLRGALRRTAYLPARRTPERASTSPAT